MMRDMIERIARTADPEPSRATTDEVAAER
jgi:hypothetical protein